MILPSTENGYKRAKESGVADNSGGSAAADINVTLKYTELGNVLAVESITVLGAAAYVTSYSISGNTVTVTVNVPAGAKATVEAVVVGY